MSDLATAPGLVRIAENGTDPELAVSFYEQQYHSRGIRFSLADEPFRFAYRAIGDQRLTLRSSHVSAHRSGTLSPDRQYRLTWSLDGRFVVDQGAGAVVVERSTPAMFPTTGPFRVTAEPSSQQVLQFDADFLEAVAVAGTDLPATPLELPITAPTPLLRGLRAVLRAHARELMDASISAEERASLDVAVAEAVLAAFIPGQGGHRPVVQGASVVERAEDYMRQSFDGHVTVSDIAVAVGVSVRTLQQAFLDELQTTPMRRLRDLRLAKARAALQLACPTTETVAGIARANGFRHMGRFSGAYLSIIGEHPSETLAARR